MNIWLFFGVLLLGALVGSIVTNWFNHVASKLGQKKMMDDGDMFIRADGKWYPRSPYKPDSGKVIVNERGYLGVKDEDK